MIKLQKDKLFAYITIFICIGFFLTTGPIAQDTLYHRFADQETLFNIDNFYNVISNLPFVIVGFIAIRFLQKTPIYYINQPEKYAWVILFYSIALTGLGLAITILSQIIYLYFGIEHL